MFACSSSVFPQETDVHPRRLGIKDIEVVSQFKNGYAWVKTKDIYKKELRKRNLQSIGVVSTNVKQQATTNNGVLMGQDSLVYFDYPFDSCIARKSCRIRNKTWAQTSDSWSDHGFYAWYPTGEKGTFVQFNHS